jgi:hypothetical protein
MHEEGKVDLIPKKPKNILRNYDVCCKIKKLTLCQHLAVYIFEITMATYTMALAQQLALLFAGR